MELCSLVKWGSYWWVYRSNDISVHNDFCLFLTEGRYRNQWFLFWTGRGRPAVSWGHPAYSFIRNWQSKLIFCLGLKWLCGISYSAQKSKARKWHMKFLSGARFLFWQNLAKPVPRSGGAHWALTPFRSVGTSYMAITIELCFSLDKDLIPFSILTSEKTWKVSQKKNILGFSGGFPLV